MERVYNYKRVYKSHSLTGQFIDLGNAGSFREITVRQSIPPDECVINGITFSSFHIIDSVVNKRIFTSYRSEQAPSILLIVWKDYPFYPQIEEGGDFMLQVLYEDKRVRHLVIDNTYVRSGWMNDKMSDYLNNGWMPGLIELELESFCHLQAESYLGELSFKKFGELVSENISIIAERLGKKAFRYFPVETSEISLDGLIDEEKRKIALSKALDIIKSLQ